MKQVLIRDIDDNLLNKLKNLAKKHGRSLQAELKLIISNATETSDIQPFLAAKKIRKKLESTQKNFTDSVALLKEDRQR